MSRGVCTRCGAIKPSFDQICGQCGFLAEGEGLAVAWLLSEENLAVQELEAVAERVRAGESVRPSPRQVDRARRALGRHFDSDPGLSVGERMAVLAGGVVLTPLLGWAIALWWFGTRPRAAMQALALSLPLTVLFFALVVWLATV